MKLDFSKTFDYTLCERDVIKTMSNMTLHYVSRLHLSRTESSLNFCFSIVLVLVVSLNYVLKQLYIRDILTPKTPRF